MYFSCVFDKREHTDHAAQNYGNIINEHQKDNEWESHKEQ